MCRIVTSWEVLSHLVITTITEARSAEVILWLLRDILNGLKQTTRLLCGLKFVHYKTSKCTGVFAVGRFDAVV